MGVPNKAAPPGPTAEDPLDEPDLDPKQVRLRRLAARSLVVLAIFLGWAGWQVVGGVRQRAALASLGEEVDGRRLTWSGRVQGVRLTGADDESLLTLSDLSLPDLRVLQLTDCEFSMDAIRRLPRFRRLVELNLRGTPLPPSSAEILQQFTTLQRLDVTRCGFTSEQAAAIQAALPEARVAH